MSECVWSELTPDAHVAHVAGVRRGTILRAGPRWVWQVEGGGAGLALDEAEARALVEGADVGPGEAGPAEPILAAALEGAVAAVSEQSIASVVAPPRPVRSLAARIVDRAPLEVQTKLRGRADRVEGYTAAIRALAEEGGAPDQIAAMLAEVDADAHALVEAALEVIRERQTALAYAETRIALAKEELERARRDAEEIETSVERVKEQVIRPTCEACGEGETRAIRAMTGRVSIVKKPPRVVLDEDSDTLDFIGAMDPTLIRIKREPDKKAIAAAIDAGRTVPGASLVRETRVEVRG